MRLIKRLASALTAWSVHWAPNSFIIAALPTLFVFALALVLTDTGPLDCVIHWGDGFWELLSFGMQMCLIIYWVHRGGVTAATARA